MRTVITTTGTILATRVSPQRAAAIAMKAGANPAGVYVIRGNAADAKAVMARMVERSAAVWTTDRIEAGRMGVAL